MSERSQHYKLILSSPFKTTLPLEGELPGNHSLQIPLYIDPLFYTNKETVNYMALGYFKLTNRSIIAIDYNSSNPLMDVCQLHGYIGELIWNQVRDGVETIQFPHTNVSIPKTRSFIIRNKSHLVLEWSGKLSYLFRKY
jgi:hypothetical protein